MLFVFKEPKGRMEKNQIIGLILIFLLLLGYTVLNKPSQEELDAAADRKEIIEEERTEALEENTAKIEAPAVPDSIQQQLDQQTFGSFSESTRGTEEIITLENEKLKLSFSTKGASIKEALLKEHFEILQDSAFNETKVNVRLLNNPKNKFEYSLPLKSGALGRISTESLYFTPVKSGNSVKFTAKTSNGGSIIQSYSLDSSYNVRYNVEFVNLGGTITSGDESIRLNWVDYLNSIELNEEFEKRYSTVYFRDREEKSTDYCSCTGDDIESIEGGIDWVSNVNQFFNTSLITKDKAFSSGKMETKLLSDGSNSLKVITNELHIPYDGNTSESLALNMYIGPNDYDVLRAYDKELENIIPFGTSVFGTINRHVIRPAFNFLNKYIGIKGIAIIVMIFIIKMLLYPLTYKMLYSQAKMSALKPTISKLTDKYKDDAQKKQMETMKVYQEYGVSPLGGCMPMIIQTPIWYALFRFFPASITFRQESFLWATDLSSFDVIARLPFEIPMFGAHISLFTILWAVTTVMYTYYNTKHMDMSANPAMKYVQYFMPVMFLVFFNNYASGLTCYMFFSNLFNILQTVLTKRFAFDNEKILAQLNLQKANPKKKSGFQAKLQEAYRQQQAMQAKKDKKK